MKTAELFAGNLGLCTLEKIGGVAVQLSKKHSISTTVVKTPKGSGGVSAPSKKALAALTAATPGKLSMMSAKMLAEKDKNEREDAVATAKGEAVVREWGLLKPLCPSAFGFNQLSVPIRQEPLDLLVAKRLVRLQIRSDDVICASRARLPEIKKAATEISSEVAAMLARATEAWPKAIFSSSIESGTWPTAAEMGGDASVRAIRSQRSNDSSMVLSSARLSYHLYHARSQAYSDDAGEDPWDVAEDDMPSSTDTGEVMDGEDLTKLSANSLVRRRKRLLSRLPKLMSSYVQLERALGNSSQQQPFAAVVLGSGILGEEAKCLLEGAFAGATTAPAVAKRRVDAWGRLRAGTQVLPALEGVLAAACDIAAGNAPSEEASPPDGSVPTGSSGLRAFMPPQAVHTEALIKALQEELGRTRARNAQLEARVEMLGTRSHEADKEADAEDMGFNSPV
jgi:hypothetical protein